MASRDLDVLAYPTIRRKPAVIGAIQEGANCQLSANSGLPAISVPAGFTSDGLPVGLELLARPWQEGLLLAMAYAYEQGAPHRRPPQLKKEKSNESNGIRRR
jgi:Asp-tRNA(Asn)/Glu-tRNA(Gln) amidotransferase A subunit family amidase